MRTTHIASAPISEVFNQRDTQEEKPNKAVFMPFVMGGFPTYDLSIQVARTLQDEGADVIEVGLPYSDPLADGPTIQYASEIARQQGINISSGLHLLKDMRKTGIHIPLILFCYYNPILQYGLERFVQDAIEVGANGVIVPDLPFEESQELRSICKEKQLAFISLVAPNSKERIKRIAQEAEGFLYCISSLGVTGARESFTEQMDEYLAEVRKYARVPVTVGFGISKREHVHFFSQRADGYIIASAIIDYLRPKLYLLEKEEGKEEFLNALKIFVQELISE